jgi:predicted MFS family arabinose efflux permease
MSREDELIKQTYFWDRFRGAAQGILETGYTGLALVIAIEVFKAPDGIKSLIAAANPIGLLFTPLTLGFFSWSNRPVNKIAGNLFILSGLCIAASAFSQSLLVYLILLILSAIAATQAIPLIAHIYSENYPPHKRGTFLATSLMFSVTSTLVFSLLFGKLLDYDVSYYTTVLAVLAIASLVCGLSVRRMPTSIVHKHSNRNPLRNLGYAFTDWKFGVMLLSWMFVGLGNLMITPLRIEYLLVADYGIQSSIVMVSWLTLGLPAICRFVSVKFWGRLFDSIDFMILRMIINSLQLISIILFFSTQNFWILSLAAMLNGIAMGGGTLSWNLWVTKFATRERTAAYMSVHTFLTGIRGFVAPFLGFYLIARFGPRITSLAGAAMILVSIIMVFWLYRAIKPKQTTV